MDKNGKILAMDIGAGTQDILFFDPRLTPENCISLILPTPTRFFVKQIESCQQNLFIDGDPIGGGAVSSQLRKHIEKGYRVTMTEDAAYTVRNNLREVKHYGIEIAGDKETTINGAQLSFTEINIPLLKRFLSHYGEDLKPDLIALAVQDHGTPPQGRSNREFRFQHIEERLKEDNSPESFVYKSNEIPLSFKRMNAVARSANRHGNCEVVLMDTAFAAILGCMEESRSALFINVGNSHTLAALVREGMIFGLFEHHTSCLTRDKLEKFLMKFQRGTLSSQEVLDDGGHGSIVLDNYRMDSREEIIVTGPNRGLLEQSTLNVRFAAPYGNMMLTGPFGLVKGALLRQD
jgi:uncharacterized protein (DUF1786 family)